MPKKYHVVVAILATTFLFALHDATLKHLSAYYAVPLLIWARYVVQFVLMLLTVAPAMGREILVTERPALMLFRALMQVLTALFVQLALKYMPLAETTALVFMSPLLVALLAGAILGERQQSHNWYAIAAGFLGVLLIAKPSGANLGIGVVYALAAALCNAFYQLMTRKLSTSEPPMRQLFYLTLVGVVVMSCVLPEYWTGEPPALVDAVLLVSAAFCVAVGHFLFIRASKETPASTLSALLYSKLIWAVMLGLAIFKQLPDILSVVGMLVIGASGLYLVLCKSPAPAAAAR